MYLEGCEPFLGCTIVLSGPQMEELKIVKKALKKCLKIARVLVLEKAYYIFIQSDVKRLTVGNSEEVKASPFLL
jgi:hypothetical protein